MKSEEKTQIKKMGEPAYLNKNCWLVKNLNYSPYKRCQYCELKFRNCLFLHYQIISLILTIFILAISFSIGTGSLGLLIISVFTLVIVYGYFFNKSTNKLIQANFSERKAKELLKDLNENLQQKVAEQTKEISRAYEAEKAARQREEKEHQQLRKEWERLNEAKSQFMVATQHHLRTPLTSMQGYLDLVLEGHYGRIPPKIKEILIKFQGSTRNEIKIVEDMLNISQFQLGKEIVLLLPNTNIEAILEKIVEELKYEADKKGIYLKLEKPQKESKLPTGQAAKIPRIKGDFSKLVIALTNLIDNAVKYTEKGGVIIKIKNEISKIKIIIKDTGIGIEKEQAKDLFARIFERSKTAKKLYATGRGIGLYITSKIIQAHKGRIWVESEGPNKGSTFYVELPVG